MNFFDELIQIIAHLISGIISGEYRILYALSDMIYQNPSFFAVYIQISTMLLVFMTYMLYRRKKQREEKKPDAQMMITPVASNTAPDRTVSNAIILFVVVGSILLIAFS